MDVDTKIEQFSKIIFKEAEEEKSKILAEMDEKYKKAIVDLKTNALKTSNIRIIQEKEILDKEYNKQVLQLNGGLRKDLIKRRDELAAQIFETVERRLDEFVRSPQYVDWLVSIIEEAKGIFGSNDIKVFITHNDMRFENDIKAKTGVQVIESAINFIGGCRLVCESKKIAMDKTIMTGFAEQKASFNKLKIS